MKKSYNYLLNKAILYDQSEVVAFLLKHEKNIDLEECFFNKYDIKLKQQTGTSIIPCSLFYDKMDEHGEKYTKLLEQKEKLLEGNKDITEIDKQIESLLAHFTEYDKGIIKDRTFYEWRLVPHWLAEKLVNKGETVFKYLGSNWWGIRNIRKTDIFSNNVLKSLLRDISL